MIISVSACKTTARDVITSRVTEDAQMIQGAGSGKRLPTENCSVEILVDKRSNILSILAHGEVHLSNVMLISRDREYEQIKPRHFRCCQPIFVLSITCQVVLQS